jgi:hypothetical protein
MASKKKMPAFLLNMYGKAGAKGKKGGKGKKAAPFKKIAKGGKTLRGTNKSGQRTAAQRG